MKRRVMVDLNVILDVLENRAEWVSASAGVCALCTEGKIVGFVPSHALTTIYYIVRKRGGKALADKAIDWMLSVFRVARCGADEFRMARNGDVDDFEDAVVASSALAEKCEVIVTRNVAHFAASPVPPTTPSMFLQSGVKCK
jgi:predicted nucleic acid-binding protein